MRFFFIFIFSLLVFCVPTFAAEIQNPGMRDFKRIPVLHEGRIKPLDSMARADLKRITGDDYIDGHSATEWIAEVFFDPRQAINRPLFRIHSNFVKKQFGLEDATRDVFSFSEVSPGLVRAEKTLSSLSEINQNDLTEDQKSLVSFYNVAALYAGILRGIDFLPQEKAQDKLWNSLEAAYKENNSKLWREASLQLRELRMDNISETMARARMEAELVYNGFKVWRVSQIFYVVSLIFACVYFWRKMPFIKPLLWSSVIFAVAAHGVALGMRMFILLRPPVGSLYESILFVSFVVALGALIFGWRLKDYLLLAGGLFITLCLLFIAPLFAPERDSLEMLVAVLNTNFWLATHVICITAGYGVCVLTALLAHFALIKRARKKPDMVLEGRIYLFLLASLFFTAVGTVLGGIWADQSWGRFWGWDPKENGALLIVLWIIWILHGKWTGHLGIRTYLTVIALLNIVVAFSWIGVNLLGTGLHSYGFTNSMFQGFVSFCAIEAMLVAVIYVWAGKAVQIGTSA